MKLKKRGVLPGFGLTFGYTIATVSLLVLLPLGALLLRATSLSLRDVWAMITEPRALSAYRVSFVASFAGALVNGVFGILLAWVLVRYQFPGRSLLDAVIDLPFALPTAVAGISLTAAYSEHGFIGEALGKLGVKVAFTRLGVIVALVFVGIPFVVRTVQPVLEELEPDVEEAASVLGASRFYAFRRVVFPALLPAASTGFALSFARALGEYGSVVFISGNLPMKTEIVPLLIVTKLEQYDYAGATALSSVMLAVSFLLLFGVNLLGRWARRAEA